jgi:hypothetical protein
VPYIPIPSTPFAELLPALRGHQPVIVISFAPHIMALHVGLIALSVRTPFMDLGRNSLGAELFEMLFYRLQCSGWEIPWAINIPSCVLISGALT